MGCRTRLGNPGTATGVNKRIKSSQQRKYENKTNTKKAVKNEKKIEEEENDDNIQRANILFIVMSP